MTRLLAHYWTADDHLAVRQAQIEDWLEDLAEFSPEVVAAACREWRQSNDKRPTPHGIRALAVAEQRRRNPDPEPVYIPPPTPRERTPDEIAYAEKRFAEMKRIIADSVSAQRRKPARPQFVIPTPEHVQDDPNTNDPQGEQL